MSSLARIETGFLLRRLQQGDVLSLPPSIGKHCHELHTTWRIVYRLDSDVIVIAEVFTKKTQQTPSHVITVCQKRLRHYDSVVGDSNDE